METHVASTASTTHQEMGCMSHNDLLVRLKISKCVFVRKCHRGGCSVRVLTNVKMVFNTRDLGALELHIQTNTEDRCHSTPRNKIVISWTDWSLNVQVKRFVLQIIFGGKSLPSSFNFFYCFLISRSASCHHIPTKLKDQLNKDDE